jgi:hypothetical protein
METKYIELESGRKIGEHSITGGYVIFSEDANPISRREVKEFMSLRLTRPHEMGEPLGEVEKNKWGCCKAPMVDQYGDSIHEDDLIAVPSENFVPSMGTVFVDNVGEPWKVRYPLPNGWLVVNLELAIQRGSVVCGGECD